MMINKEFYRQEIINSFLPFWKKAVDNTNGGIYTCFSNDGSTLISTDKYVWSQGRYLWIWARIVDLIRKGLLPLEEDSYVQELDKTISFLIDHAFLENGNAIFLLDFEGNPKLNNGVYDSSVYVDCFLCLGFAEYARVLGNKEILEKAVLIYQNITNRIDENNYLTMPYPIPEGYSIFGIPMFVMHVGQELSQALKSSNDPRYKDVQNQAKKYQDILLTKFIKDGYNIEMLSTESNSDTLLSNHLTPGHTLECLWFVIHLLRDTDNWQPLTLIENCAKNAFEKGWDTEYGGLLRFVHQDGGIPKGRLLNDVYEKLIIDTWDYKLWWVHSEALYFCGLMGQYGDSEYWKNAYKQIFDYTFKTFPNPDPSIKEWIQVRLRDGQASDKVVALPVKDPYHILRNFLLILEL